jgi:nucleotide-binding universal stress UspA family protein
MRILLAIDEPQSSAQTIERVVHQFRQEEAEVRVIHVLQPISVSVPPQMAAGYAPELQDFSKQAKEMLEQTAKFLTDAGYKTDTLLRKGDIREEILNCARDWKADLIVMGSRGHGGKRLLLGSVAESVARQAQCSVELVRACNGN